MGITPEKIGEIAIKKGIPTLIKYFDQSTANLVLKKYGKAKVVTATNVFAHIENVQKLMKNILKILDKDGIFLSESHYLVSLIKTVQYDTIYHEHLRYYSLKSLNYIFKKYILEIILAFEAAVIAVSDPDKNPDNRIRKIIIYNKTKLLRVIIKIN